MKLICHEIGNVLTFDYYVGDDNEFRKRYTISNLNTCADIMDFKWLFDFLGTIFKPFKEFTDCTVKYEESYVEDEWDSYCNTTVIHTFKNGTTLESKYYDLTEECNDFTTVEEILHLISKVTGIEIKYYYEY